MVFNIIILFIVVTFFGWNYVKKTTPKTPGLQKSASMPDNIITNLIVKRFDEKGQITHSLVSPLVHHFGTLDTHLVFKPEVRIIQEAQAPWILHANQANFFRKADSVIFSGNVVIQQAASPHAKPTIITTEELTYFPKQKLATTELAIRFVQPGSVVNAKGIKAFLAEKRIELLHQARINYDPTSHA